MRGDIRPPKRNEQIPGVPVRVSDNVIPEQKQGMDQQPAVATTSPDVPLPDMEPIEEPKRQPAKRSHAFKWFMWSIVGIIIICVTALIAGSIWYNHELSAVDPANDEKVKITIEPGSDVATIASVLKRNDLIRSEGAFGWYVRLEGKANLLQSGSYRLSKSEDVSKIVTHLTSGNTDKFSITFLPGATLSKHRQVLIDAGYSEDQVDAALSKRYDHPLFAGRPAEADLEGYIYGETYNFPADATPEQILVRTFDQFQSVVTDENLVELYKRQGFSLYQGITMASIIQREVATPGDAAQVAQVFKLRYDRGMQLGSDVTYQYIADKTGQERSVDLDSPYNTRRYAGLPPGPISSPGIDSLKAVGSPARGDFVYFLSGDDDKTYFARTNEEHEQNIRDHCQKKCQII
jgi:UPF0755 protein